MQSRVMLGLGLVLCSSPFYGQSVGSSLPSVPLQLNQSISLPNTIKGNFDHFGMDLKRQHLFATPEDAKAILVIDLNTGKLTYQISGIARPHAVLYREDLNRIYVTDGGDGLL